MLAIMLPVLFLLAAYAINIAYLEAINTDVQVVADVAVQAAGRAYIQTEDVGASLAAAQDAASRNPVGGVTVPISMSDLQFGISRRASVNSAYSFTPVSAGTTGNAVRLETSTLHNAATSPLTPAFPTFGVDFDIRPERVAISTQSTMDVALVIDRSGSMAYGATEMPNPYAPPVSAPPGWNFGQPVPPNARWLDLVASIQVFSNHLNDSPQREQLSLSTYAGTTSTDTRLTYDFNAVVAALNGHSAAFQGGNTAIGLGIREGLGALTDPTLSRDFAVRVMILMTDGIHNQNVNPENVMSELKSAGVTLFTVTFSDSADKTRMAKLAASGGGAHFHAANAAQLIVAFEEIAKSLPSLMTK